MFPLFPSRFREHSLRYLGCLLSASYLSINNDLCVTRRFKGPYYDHRCTGDKKKAARDISAVNNAAVLENTILREHRSSFATILHRKTTESKETGGSRRKERRGERAERASSAWNCSDHEETPAGGWSLGGDNLFPLQFRRYNARAKILPDLCNHAHPPTPFFSFRRKKRDRGHACSYFI